jgi:uncharacterized membrane protein
MSSWSIDMVRQSGWDLWVLVCAAGSLVLLSYMLGKLWAAGTGGLASTFTWVLGSAGVLGTVIVILLPPLHRPGVGLVWTFSLLSIVSATFYLHLRDQLSAGRTGVLLGMRITALAFLVPMLFEPVVRFISIPKPERPLVFLIDTSGSMSFPDTQNGPTRLQSVYQALRPEMETINQHFVPSFFTFDISARLLKSPEELGHLQADGQSTDIVGAIKKTLSLTTRDDSAVVLMTDGIDNTSPDAAEAVRMSPHPIHTIRVGSDQAEPSSIVNVAVDNIESPDDFVVNHATTIKAAIKSTALANRVVDVKLSELDEQNKPVGELITQKLVLQPTPEGQVVELAYKPVKVGLHRVAVWIDPIAGERNVIDNRQEFQGMAIDPRMKVLYIEGSVRLEYKWTRHAFISDSNIELATYLRKSNTEIEAAGTVDGEPFTALPVTAEQWKKFDVIVIGDIDSSYLSLAQQQLIEQRVSDGGGLLMLGGQNSFGPGGYQSSPIEKVLPVFVGDKSIGQDMSKFVPGLTAEGQTQPILDGLTDWFAAGEKTAVKPLPPLNGNVIVSKAKSGAAVLLVHPDRQGPDGNAEIVLATQRYGQGRSAAFTVDTTYLWFLPLRGMGQESPYNKLWGQMIRWLAGQDVRDRQRGAGLQALINKSNYQLGENVKLRALVRDERGDATRYAQVNVTISGGGGGGGADQKPQTLALTPTDSQPGMYELILPNPDKGDYQLKVVATKDGKELGRQKLNFTVIPPADEMLKIAANPQLLAAIADETHGYHYDLGQFPQLIDQLIRSDPKFGQPQQRAVPLDDFVGAAAIAAGGHAAWDAKYDLPLQGLVMIVLLIGEWFLRRRWQLA